MELLNQSKMVLYASIAAIFILQCDARNTRHFKDSLSYPSSRLKMRPLRRISEDPLMVAADSPFPLPPLEDSNGYGSPISMPQNAPPFCVYPPFPPSSPGTPAVIFPQPPPGSSAPLPPFPPGLPNPPEYVPSPPIYVGAPPAVSPTPPVTVPSPPAGFVPSPPEGFVPSPPAGFVPSPPAGFVPSPPEGFVPSPPEGYVPSPPEVFVPGPPEGFVPSPPEGYVPSPPEFVPGPPVYLPPVVFPPPAGPPPPRFGPSFTLWCVAKPSVPEPIILEAMNYACGSGADCQSIQPEGSCYQPDTVVSHASFAFNSYWQRTKAAGGTCDFGGTAMLITADPSFDGCRFLYF